MSNAGHETAIDDSTRVLGAIAAAGPSRSIPQVSGLSENAHLRYVSEFYKRGWVTAHVFQGMQVGAGQLLDLTQQGHEELQRRWDDQDLAVSDPPDVSLQEKRERRSRYLTTMYEITDGNPAVLVPSSTIARRLAYTDDMTLATSRQLRIQGLIAYRGTGPLVSLTPKGVAEAEQIIEPESRPQGQMELRDDRDFMERAIKLARRCRNEPGRISPKVGAIAVRDNSILGEAFRGEVAPGDHAEFILLENKLPEEPLAGATIYTTLEPCTARNSPKIPCVERLIERRVARVVIGVLDPNELIRGRGELRLREAGIEVTRFDPDLMSQIEELNRDFTRSQVGAHQVERTKSQTTDPADPDEVGPNGHRVGYTADGDKVEWVPDEENPSEFWPMLLRRNDERILDAYNEYWEKVWWHRHQAWRQQVKEGDDGPSDAPEGVFARASAAAARIEEKYGRDNLLAMATSSLVSSADVCRPYRGCSERNGMSPWTHRRVCRLMRSSPFVPVANHTDA